MRALCIKGSRLDIHYEMSKDLRFQTVLAAFWSSRKLYPHFDLNACGDFVRNFASSREIPLGNPLRITSGASALLSIFRFLDFFFQSSRSVIWSFIHKTRADKKQTRTRISIVYSNVSRKIGHRKMPYTVAKRGQRMV